LKRQLGRFLAAFAAVLLCGCALVEGPAERAASMASAAGFRSAGHGPDGLLTYRRGESGQRMVVYIESDGAPWRRADEPPADPTPIQQIVLRMAVADPSEAVVYMGRKCQYLSEAELGKCDPDLWMLGRFRPDAIAATNRSIDAVKKMFGASSIALVGYSGGGAMAALVASRRGDVDCLVTLAAPLDTQAWTAAIGVTPLRNSLNPALEAPRLQAMRQTHFRGGRDAVVPKASLQRFLQAVPNANVIDLEDFDHDCCWASRWAQLRQQSCLAQ
jgi:pimeloyl-ACP methyl ester carboxylesterase